MVDASDIVSACYPSILRIAQIFEQFFLVIRVTRRVSMVNTEHRQERETHKEQQDYVRVKVDTENYRSRRKDTLENLAKNIAFKVRKTRKPVVLEPMNPYERRIIHSALQGNKYVETYSEGNEPYRHVVVVYKGK